MLIGLPEHIDTNVLFKEGVSYFTSHKGLEVYMRYERSNPSLMHGTKNFSAEVLL
jgi:hypothetical protein